jgi:pyruvate formate lyase activating enzyme
MVVFGGVQKVSLIDYPDNVAMVFFTVGCNFRCPFCHNPDLIFNAPYTFDIDKALEMIKVRKNLINSIVITGGEPTIHKDLPFFIKKVKEMGLKVKLDSNGSSPSMLKECIEELDVDYIAMDVKTSLEKYKMVGYKDVNNIKESINLIKEKAKDYEFRVTLAPGIINLEDLKEVGELVKGAKKFYLQQFRQGDNLDKEFNPTPYTFEQIDLFKEILSHYVEKVELRI